MNRVCSIIVSLALMSSMLMAQTSPNVPTGRGVNDVINELVKAGVVNRPAGTDPNTIYTREQAATMTIEAMNSIRNSMETQPDLRTISVSDIDFSVGEVHERNLAKLNSASRLFGQAIKIIKLSAELQDELSAHSTDVAAFIHMCGETEIATSRLKYTLSQLWFKGVIQDTPEIAENHWAYDSLRQMMSDGMMIDYETALKKNDQHLTASLVAVLIMSVPDVLKTRVADHEVVVSRWSDAMSQNKPDSEADARLAAEHAMLSKHNVAMVALCYEFSNELQALGFDPNTIKKTAIDIGSRLKKSEHVMYIARSKAVERNALRSSAANTSPHKAANIGFRQGKWISTPPAGSSSNNFWPFFGNLQ